MATLSPAATGRQLPLAPLGLFFCLVVASWYSLRELGTLALSDTPVAFAAAVPFLAAYLLFHDGRRPAAPPGRSDIFVDWLIFIGICAVAFYLILFLPAQLSWYYWLQRFDLLLVPLFAIAAAVLGWGTGGAMVVRRALVYLFLVWPFPFILVQQFIGPVFTYLSAAFTRLWVGLLALPMRVDPDDPYSFISTGPERFTIIIADTCSGMNALLGFLVVALPLVLTWSGSRSSKVGWIATGMLAAWISNFVRIGILFVLAATSGVDFALGVIHPILGAVLFALVIGAMLVLRGRFGLGTEPAPDGAPADSQLHAAVRRPALAAVGLVAVLLGVGQLVLTQFGPLNSESLPRIPVREATALLPELPGWRREVRDTISWQNLFGRDSQSRLLRYTSDDASMVVQLVATPDKRLLDSYSPENCDLFHGERIEGVSTINLDYGLAARLVESRLIRPGEPDLPSATLYWFMPVVIGDREFHARVALLADTEMLGTRPPPRVESPANPVADLPALLTSRLQPYAMAGRSGEFAVLDDHVLSFGRQMVRTMLANRSN